MRTAKILLGALMGFLAALAFETIAGGPIVIFAIAGLVVGGYLADHYAYGN